jgi:hypothetical protein
MSRRKRKGIHERLTEIMQELTCEHDLGREFDGRFFLGAQERAQVRRSAARLVELMDEYDRLDPLPGGNAEPKP